MQYRVIGPDGRIKMWTCCMDMINAEEHKQQRAAGYKFEVFDATAAELAELARRGIKVKVRKGGGADA